MPYLSPEDRARLETVDKCPRCKQTRRKLYCNICDEFWYSCDCPRKPDPPDSFYKSDHSDCRRGT